MVTIYNSEHLNEKRQIPNWIFQRLKNRDFIWQDGNNWLYGHNAEFFEALTKFEKEYEVRHMI